MEFGDNVPERVWAAAQRSPFICEKRGCQAKAWQLLFRAQSIFRSKDGFFTIQRDRKQASLIFKVKAEAEPAREGFSFCVTKKPRVGEG